MADPLSKDSKDAAAVGNWLTPERGGCIAAGVNGPFTGKGYSLGIIDDPYKGLADAWWPGCWSRSWGRPRSTGMCSTCQRSPSR